MRKFIYFILSVFSIIFLNIYTFTTAFIVIIFSIFNSHKLINKIVHFWAKHSFTIIFKKLTIKNLDQIDKTKKYILVANHGSMYDIMAIMAFFPEVSWFGKESLLKIPILGKALKAIHFVSMKSSDLKNTKMMIEKLAQNSQIKTIAIFPEGTRTLNGDFGKFKKGFVHVLKATKLDILPVTLNGFYKLKQKNRFSFDFSSKLEIIIGQPINSKELIDKESNEITKIVKNKILLNYKNS